jgi:hypothetical protein
VVADMAPASGQSDGNKQLTALLMIDPHSDSFPREARYGIAWRLLRKPMVVLLICCVLFRPLRLRLHRFVRLGWVGTLEPGRVMKAELHGF